MQEKVWGSSMGDVKKAAREKRRRFNVSAQSLEG